jgi:hypothetical protein
MGGETAQNQGWRVRTFCGREGLCSGIERLGGVNGGREGEGSTEDMAWS